MSVSADVVRLGASAIVPKSHSPFIGGASPILPGNLEHLINHKYQLFFYLKLLAAASIPDLYRWRGVL
jgi:hypothetical protein